MKTGCMPINYLASDLEVKYLCTLCESLKWKPEA